MGILQQPFVVFALGCILVLQCAFGVAVPSGPNDCVSDSCAGVPDGNYRWCSGCHVFVMCSNGLVHYQTCPAGLVYDAAAQACAWWAPQCALDPCGCQYGYCDATSTCVCVAGWTGDKCGTAAPVTDGGVTAPPASCGAGEEPDATDPSSCRACAVGTYNAGGATCVTCPAGQTTLSAGSTAASDCRADLLSDMEQRMEQRLEQSMEQRINSLERRMRNEFENGDNQQETDLSSLEQRLRNEFESELETDLSSLEQRIRNEFENGDNQLETDLSSAINNLDQHVRNEFEKLPRGCPDGFTKVGERYCYKKSSVGNKNDAKVFCSINRSRLPILNDRDQFTLLVEWLGRTDTQTTRYWLGLHETDDSWAWDNGIPVDASLWGTGEPDDHPHLNENEAQLYGGGIGSVQNTHRNVHALCQYSADLSSALNSLEQRLRNEFENGDNQLETDLSSAMNSLEQRMRNEFENGDNQLEKSLPPIGTVIEDTGRYSSDNWQACDGLTISRGPLSGQTTPDMIKWSAGQTGQLYGSYTSRNGYTLAQCKAWCLQETQCNSIDYFHSGSRAQDCEPHRSSVSLGADTFRSESNVVYYELTRYIMRIE